MISEDRSICQEKYINAFSLLVDSYLWLYIAFLIQHSPYHGLCNVTAIPKVGLIVYHQSVHNVTLCDVIFAQIGLCAQAKGSSMLHVPDSDLTQLSAWVTTSWCT